MPDDQPLEPITKAEPVAIADLAKLAIVVAGYFGLQVPDDTATKVVAGVVALVLFVQTTWFAWNRVTPVHRAEAAVAEVKAEAAVEVAVVKAEAAADVAKAEAPVTVTPQNLTIDLTGTPAPPDSAGLDLLRQGLKRLEVDLRGVDLGDDDTFPPAPPAPDPIPWAPTRVPPPPGLD